MADKRWRLLLYGDPKMGKTSLAETAVGPRLILDAEGGTDWLASDTVEWDLRSQLPELGDNTSVVVHVRSWEDVEDANRYLQQSSHPFRSLVLDSLTELQKICKRQITDQGMRIQDWGVLYDRMDPVLREMRDLTKHAVRPLWTVVFTALATSKDDKVVPDIQGSMARSLAGQIDTIGYLRKGTMNADGSMDRELVVDAGNNLYAGDRTKVLRRAFHGVIPITLDESTDKLAWSLEGLLQYMNQPREETQ